MSGEVNKLESTITKVGERTRVAVSHTPADEHHVSSDEEDVKEEEYEVEEGDFLADWPDETEELELVHARIGSLDELRLPRFAKHLTKLFFHLLTKLEELDLYDNKVKDPASALDKLENLSVLDLSFNLLRTVPDSLQYLRSLHTVYFVQNRISKITNLDNLASLRSLELGGNRIRKIENLGSLANLEELWLGKNKITKLENLSQLKRLKTLSLQSNRITVIECLDELADLEELYLSHNGVKRLEGLQNNIHLHTLDVGNNFIPAIENISHLTELEELWMNGNQIPDLRALESQLAHISTLQTVYLEANPCQTNDMANYRRKIMLALKQVKQIDATFVKSVDTFLQTFMSSWISSQYASISKHVTLSDLSQASTSANEETPVLKCTSEARSKDYDNVCLPLTTDAWKKRWTNMCLVPSSGGEDRRRTESRRESRYVSRDFTTEQKAERWRENPVFEADEVTMTRLDEAEGVTAIISGWLELDTDDDWIRLDAEIALHQELNYASYLNIQNAILPAPRNRQRAACYARVVDACLQSLPFMNLSIRLPVYDSSLVHDPLSASSNDAAPPMKRSASLHSVSSRPPTPRLVVSQTIEANPVPKNLEQKIDAAWETWDLIRSLCDYNPRLSLALDLTPPLPNNLTALGKWSAEAVRHIFLPASTFIANTKGYPVLPKSTQTFIRDSMAHRPSFILSGVSSGVHTRGNEVAYSQYIRHLERTSPLVQAVEKSGTVENFAQGYQDYLQAPLQPLMDNLQSITYQTFEQDPVKYKHYEEAIYRALLEWQEDGRIVICVAGAGRGPLIARCITAIERSNREAFVYGVEKNPNAFVTLQERQRSEWKDKVKLFFGDMRVVELPEQVDILVSELLGSFGDNELSPECLDGAMRLLKPDGISIPSSYTAHLAPLSSSKLYNEARSTKDDKNMETPCVVMFQAVNLLSGDGGGPSGQCGPQVQECWEFEHPRKDPILNSQSLPLTNSHNARFAKLRFHIPHAGALHGLAGYFEAVLYRNIGLSIHPQRKDQISKDMLSWFPLFFPFKEPLYLPSNSELQVTIWRLTNQRRVWYEWHAESFLYGSCLDPVSSYPLSATPTIPVTDSGVSLRVSSPLIDAVELAPERRGSIASVVSLPVAGLVKIGHTSLHNAGGRSSWIGL
ncbi:hypothetical protein D9758_003674 [Tetrapyrgos nigripes]|uniref:Protein arginine N-methyltransferase n=1 Tax=Tetrapyrgos nigripes TaxID=182062 RepID=A0A8H5LRK7_9AGAR|nr:hypothetical protein D9758_003674 [Tetrapyrgos nigripes]